MNKPIKTLALLIVEDVESDALLIVRLLKKAGYELVYKQVETPAQMRTALEERAWDFVISDFSLPQFSGVGALAILKETGLDIPFIIVSGTMGEETAVNMMKAGTQDYLMKDNLARLAPAVERELEQAEMRRERRKAQEQLLLKSSALNAAANAIVITDREGNIESANPAFTTLTGYSLEEALGKNPRDLLKSGMHDQTFYQDMWNTILSGKVWHGELVNRRKDGSLFTEEATITPLRNGDGEIRHFIAIKQDVSARKQADAALRKSEMRYRMLVENSPYCIHEIDLEGRVMSMNSSGLKMMGLQNVDEIYGTPYLDTVSNEDVERVKNQLEFALLGHATEFEFRTSNGLALQSSLVPIKDSNDRVIYLMGQSQDVTHRRRAEQALSASEAELRALFASMRDVVLVIDRQGVYRKVAPTNYDLLVRPPGELLGKNLWDVFAIEQVEVFIDAIRRVLETGRTTQIEYELLIDGLPTWFETSISPMDEDSTLWVARDITERKRTEDALAASEAELRALVEQVPVIVYTESAETRETTYISKQLEKITGYTAVEWMQDQDYWKKIIHPEDVDAVLEIDRQTSITRAPFLTEYRVLTRDGRVIWIRDEAVLIQSQDGAPLFWQGVMYDITERKHAEEDIRQRVSQLQMLYESGLALSQLLNPKEIVEKIIELLREKLGWHHTSICLYNAQDDSLRLLDFNQPGLKDEADKRAAEERYNRIIANSGDGLTGWALSTSSVVRSNDVTSDPHYIETYPGIRSGLYAPMKMGNRKIGVIGVESEQPNAFSDADERLIVTLATQAASALENARLFEETRQRVAELEMLYQSGLALSQLLHPTEIGRKILQLLEENLGWHHTRIRLYHPQDDSLELLDFHKPGINGEAEHREIVNHFQFLITHSGQGLSGWVVRHGQAVRSGDVNSDPRYVEAYPGIRSGLYVPMKLGERIVGVISIESEKPNAFSEADERLILTLANQAASAFENARLFEATRQRVMELETLNRISLILRAVTKQNEMLSIVLDEILAILKTSHGFISLYDKTTGNLEKVITRGWITQLNEPPQSIHEGIAGKVFTSGEPHISREFASDPDTFVASRSQLPPNWGGVCLPIRTTQQMLGVMSISIPSERVFNKDEIRLLSILSEMTGAALQRMQLHEQTVRRLEQLNALRAVEQSISSSHDMRLTLTLLLTHIISLLKVDAVDVLLLHPGSSQLELVIGRGFHTLGLESIRLNNSFAGRAIMENRPFVEIGIDTVNKNPQIAKFWKEEGFVRYWCVPLIVKGSIKGALEVYCRRVFTPDTEWIEFLNAFAGQAAIAIDNTQLFEDLQRANVELSLAYEATIEGWSRAMDLRDHETEGHTLRVTEITLNLARAMRVGESQLTAIRHGALLHDIGKIGVPDAILLKDGKLTDAEWALMRQHPQFARDMLLPIAYLHDALDIPYWHHEKWDGTGYPQGLMGDQIPLAARIFAVVDVWDALTNDRPYRKKWTKQKTREYIEEQSGKHFDPQIVEVFLRHIEVD